MIGVTQFPWNEFEAATCEVCGGVVSQSLEKGDRSEPINAARHSPGARWWHMSCSAVQERLDAERDAKWERRIAEFDMLRNPESL